MPAPTPKPSKPAKAAPLPLDYRHLPTAATGYDPSDVDTYIVVCVQGNDWRQVSHVQDIYQRWLAASHTPTVEAYDASRLAAVLARANYRYNPDLRPGPPPDLRTPRQKADALLNQRLPLALLARALAGDAAASAAVAAAVTQADSEVAP